MTLNLYLETTFQDTLVNIEKSIKVNRIWMNIIRFADNTSLIADNMWIFNNLIANKVEYITVTLYQY